MTFVRVAGLVVKQAFAFIMYGISLIIPRSKRIWVYGNFEADFRDNAKYFFLYTNKANKEIRHVWISPSKPLVNKLRGYGFTAYYRYSVRGLYYVLRAKVFIYTVVPSDIINGCFRGRAFLFNHWHGIPFKKIEYDIMNGPLQPFFNPKTTKEKLLRTLREPEVFRRSSAVLAPSKKVVPVFSSAFRVDEENICVGPYPRNTVFSFSHEELKTFIRYYEPKEMNDIVGKLESYDAVVIYMPTFRDAKPDFISEAIPDFSKLNEVCNKYNILFLLKAHKLTVFNEDISHLSNIKSVSNNLDVYPLLPFTDGLISDYSSIFFDYSLLRKKMVFYAYDKEEYVATREAYSRYEDVFSPDYSTSFDKLLDEIVAVKAEKGNAHQYPLCLSFVDEQKTMKDITLFIKDKINYN